MTAWWQCNNLYLLHVGVFLLTDTETMQKSQAEGESIHQQQHAEDNPVERQQAKLSMCNVELAITVICNLNEGKEVLNDAAHILNF